MSLEVHSVAAMRAKVETTFGTDETAAGVFVYVPFNEGSAQMTVTTAEIDPMAAVQSRVEGREWVRGKKSATLSFTVNLAPTGTAAASTVQAAAGALGMLLS